MLANQPNKKRLEASAEAYDAFYQSFMRHGVRHEDYEACVALEKAITAAETLGNKVLVARAYIDLSRMLRRRGLYEQAITKALFAIKSLEEEEHIIEIAKGFNSVGICYLMKGDLVKALTYLLHSLRILMEQNKLCTSNLDFIAGLHLNIAIVYIRNGDEENSLSHIAKAAEMAEAEASDTTLLRCFNAYGNVYLITNRIEEAQKFYTKSVDLSQSIGDEQSLAVAYNNMAKVFEKKGDFESALKYAFKSIDIKRKKDKYSLVVGYNRIANIFALMGNFDDASKYLGYALALADEIDAKFEKLEIFQDYAKLCAALGDFKKAYDYQCQYTELQEEVFSDEKKKTVAEMNTRYQIEQKEREAELLKESEMRIRAYATRLEQSNKELEQFAHVVSHDLKEPLRMVKSYMQLIQKTLGTNLSEDLKEFFHYAIDGSNRMERLIYDVLNLSKLQQSEQHFDQIDANDVMFVVLKNLQESIKEIGAEVFYENLPVVEADESQLIQLFQNLISNGLKYNKSERPIIWVRCKEQYDAYLFEVQDNGMGIPKEAHEDIFNMFHRVHGRNISGSGIGLAICKKIVERHNGNIHLESKVGHGTTFYIHLPKQQVI